MGALPYRAILPMLRAIACPLELKVELEEIHISHNRAL
jgi:hypothetical protein